MPRKKLPVYILATDIDRTLTHSKRRTDGQPDQDMITTINTLASLQNVRMMVWSGRGKDYAEAMISRLGLQRCFAASKLDESTWVYGKPDVAIDDVRSFSLGKINLIVKENK